jgi:plastocyanin
MKIFELTASAVVVLAITMLTADGGKISGKVTFKGKPKPAKTIKMSADAACEAMHTSPAKDEKMIVGDGTGEVHPLANVFVYVKSGVQKKDFAVPDKPVVIDQNGCRYVPHVLGIMAGQKMEFINSDKTTHNVHSLAKKSANFNNAQTAGAPVLTKTFEKEEVMVKVKCDMHPWMTCYVGVLNHPYFAVTGKDGAFSIDGLDDGEYEVEAWHELVKTRTAKVTIAGGSATVDFEYTKPKKK